MIVLYAGQPYRLDPKIGATGKGRPTKPLTDEQYAAKLRADAEADLRIINRGTWKPGAARLQEIREILECNCV